MLIKVLGSLSPYSHYDSACPSYRIYDNEMNLLLDCGSGSHRFFDMQKDLKNLHIFISHLHHDHYNDLYNYLYSSFALHNLGIIKDKIQVYLPRYPYEIYTNIIREHNSYADFNTIYDGMKVVIGGAIITFCEIQHSKDVQNLAIKVNKCDSSIVYSGDVSYIDKDKLANFAKNCDLLICESSLLKKHNFPSICNHLTAYQAGCIAKEANVQKLLLTHFWPDENLNEYEIEAKSVFENTLIAKENLILEVGE